MKKISFFLLLIFFYFVHYKTASATICSLNFGDSCGGYTYGNYRVATLDKCGYSNVTYCDKGGGDCPHCTSDSGCCSGAKSWTSYQMVCLEVSDSFGMPRNIAVYTTSSLKVYSTGDKVNPNSSYVFDSSNCNGQAVTPYKACCNTSTGQLVPYTSYAEDGNSPLEAHCTSGTQIWNNGNYLSESTAKTICAAKQPCQASCWAKINNEASCSDFNSEQTNYTYTSASGTCSDSSALCCSQTAITPPPQTLVSMYYCPALGSDCETTDPIYTSNEAGKSLCTSNLNTYNKTHVTDCFSSLPNCNSACAATYFCETADDPVCDDRDPCTTDTCKNPNTASAECIHTPITTGNCGPTPSTAPSVGGAPPCYDTRYELNNVCWAGDEQTTINNFQQANLSSNDRGTIICTFNKKPRGYMQGGDNFDYCFGEDTPATPYNIRYSCLYYANLFNWSEGDPVTCCTYKTLPDKNGTDGKCNVTTVNTIYTSDVGPLSDDCCTYGVYPDQDDIIFNSATGMWEWTCEGTPPRCSGTKGKDIGCSAVANTPPVFQGLVVKNSSDTTVAAENRTINGVGTSINHICDANFSTDKTVKFLVTVNDSDGVDDLKEVKLRLGATEYNSSSFLNGVATFIFNTTNLPSTDIYNIETKVIDNYNLDSGWVDTGRDFKIWDCKVPISGTIYDGTDGASCPNTGFGVTNPDALNLKTLVFKQNDIDFTMSIGSDKTSYYSDSNNSLIWGSDIAIPYFNRATNDIALSSPILIKTLSSSGVSTCSSDYFVNTYTNIDPYATSIGITADFTGTLVQDPWWQANGGGVISNFKIKDQVPVTCNNNDNCKISIGGLAAAPDVDNKGKSLENAQTWYYANTLAKLANYNTNYDYFYTQYFVKKAVGTVSVGKTITSVNDLGNDSNGIYFINGDLTINGDVINTGDFLMMIVKGSVNVDIGVSQVDGILVANSINASGSSDNQLVFNGSLYASDTINFSRDFTTRLDNNTKPAVVVNYDPKLIFNIPGSIAKVLTNWQWGN